MKNALGWMLAGAVIGGMAIGAAAWWWFVWLPAGAETPPQTVAAEQGTQFHCPMHPEMISDQPGDCPICNMRLVPIHEVPGDAAPAGAGSEQAESIRYHCPMHPDVVSDEPGECPICGMRLVPVDDETDAGPDPHAGHAEGTGPGDAAGAAPVEGYIPVRLAPERRQQIGVREAAVESGILVREIRTVGRVSYDESRLSTVNARVSGWIERLHVERTGSMVEEGSPLLEIYSPDLVATQEELLVAQKHVARLQTAGAPAAAVEEARALLEEARRRLDLWDVPHSQIEALESRGSVARRVTLVAPSSGHVLEKPAVEGQHVDAGESLFRIADLSRVWILAEIYEQDLDGVKPGQEAVISLPYDPGSGERRARVDYIYPYLDPVTRTVQVRLVLPNPDLALRPEMYVDVRLRVASERPVVMVPSEAVLDTGERRIVFVSRGEGLFEPREVTLGQRSADHAEVIAGLAAGERVVVSGNFLIDSESRLKAALAGRGGGSHRHGG